jgi:hypothetical protein
MIGTLETELWRLKGCEIFYGFVIFLYRIIAAASFKCKFSVSNHSVLDIDGSKRHRTGDSTTVRSKEYELDRHFGSSTVILHKPQLTDWLTELMRHL